MEQIEEIILEITKQLDKVENTLDLLKVEKSIDKVIYKKKLDLKNKEIVSNEIKNIDIFCHYFDTQVKKFNLTMLEVSQESGVSLTTLYKIRKNSFGDISKIPSAKIRNKLVKYLQEKEKKANK